MTKADVRELWLRAFRGRVAWLEDKLGGREIDYTVRTHFEKCLAESQLTVERLLYDLRAAN